MPVAGILPDKSTAERSQKTEAPPERSAASFLTDNIQCHASAEHEKVQHIKCQQPQILLHTLLM